jgi:hypothetical protein
MHTVFGDDKTRRAWVEECNQARYRQRCRYAIAPRAVFVTHDGRRLVAGDEFIPSRDLVHVRYTEAWSGSHLLIERGVVQQLERLLGEETVLEHPMYRHDDGPSAA